MGNRLEIDNVVEKLCKPESYQKLFHRTRHDEPMPSIVDLETIIELLRGICFPGYFGFSDLRTDRMRYYIGSKLDIVSRLLCEQIKRGFCFSCERDACMDCIEKSRQIAQNFIDRLPDIRNSLSTDVQAAYEGDPASNSFGETIFCYPSLTAVTYYRIAHELLSLGVPLIPRMISELAHSKTGIDIHPGAVIGDYFFIDHGTGTVIGETCEIGERVRIYQGVTLGAKSFPLDKDGKPIKGIKRHPILEDNVIIYSGATLLGRITIGTGSVIGGNVWLTHGLQPFSRVLQGKPVEERYLDGAGI